MSNLVLEIVNVVGSGTLNRELDLDGVATCLGDKAEFNPEKYHGLYYRQSDSAPLVTIYRSGKYIVTGGDSEEESFKTRDKLLRDLQKIGVLDETVNTGFSVQNLVCQGNLGIRVNLDAFGFGLDLRILSTNQNSSRVWFIDPQTWNSFFWYSRVEK